MGVFYFAASTQSFLLAFIIIIITFGAGSFHRTDIIEKLSKPAFYRILLVIYIKHLQFPRHWTEWYFHLT